MAGRPRKPTALKLLAGNPGKRAIPEEREVEHAPAVKPAWLVEPSAAAVWEELAPSRMEIGLLTDKTAEAFAHLCVYLGMMRMSPLLLKPAQITDMRYLRAAFGFEAVGLAKAGIAIGGKKKGPTNPFHDLTGS